MALPLVIPGISAARYYSGADLGATRWIPISQERIDLFAEATGDRNWIHTDVERASRETPWKCTIIPGALLLSLVPGLLPELLLFLGWGRALNSSAERCVFGHPAPAGSSVRMAARIAKARALSGNGCRLSFAVRFEAEGASGDEGPACSATVHYLYYP
jgi:acyl dehydratase